MSSFAFRRVHTSSGALLGALALAASAWFVTRILHTLEAGHAEAAPVAIAPAPAALPPPPPRVVRDGAALVTRNMFCASCTGTTPPPGGAAGIARFTARLIATSVEASGRGAATLHDPITGAAGWFPIGATAPGGAVIVAVRRDAIDVRFPDDTEETVALAGAATAPPPPAAPTAPASKWGERVRELGPDRWEVDRSLIGELVGGGTATAVPGVRLMPVAKDGKLGGIKVAAARPGSLARALGLQPGDVIEAVGGRPLDSAAMLMELYGELDRLPRVELSVRRGDATRTLTYELR